MLFLKKKNVEVTFQIRSHVDRRKVKDRRLVHKKGYLDHNSERRVNMIDRRILPERRKLVSEIIKTFWQEEL